MIIIQTQNLVELSTSLAQSMLLKLYEKDNKLLREVYLEILKKIAEVYKNIIQSLTQWILSLDDEVKIIFFLKKNLIFI